MNNKTVELQKMKFGQKCKEKEMNFWFFQKASYQWKCIRYL